MADQVVGRITDTIMSLPPLLLVIVFVSIVGPSLESVVVVIALLTWPWIARLVRGQYLSLRESEFVTAARRRRRARPRRSSSATCCRTSWAR